MPRGKKMSPEASTDPPSDRNAEERTESGVASDEREHQSAYVTDDGRHFRVLYTPDVHEPRWFVRSFVVGPDGAAEDIRDYPERFYDEAAAWEGARQMADGTERT